MISNDENFTDKETGQFLLVRCPECERENWAIMVTSGICAWCGFSKKNKNENKND